MESIDDKKLAVLRSIFLGEKVEPNRGRVSRILERTADHQLRRGESTRRYSEELDPELEQQNV